MTNNYNNIIKYIIERRKELLYKYKELKNSNIDKLDLLTLKIRWQELGMLLDKFESDDDIDDNIFEWFDLSENE